PVIEFDLPLLEEKAKSTLTPVVISNMDEIKELIKLSGSVTVGLQQSDLEPTVLERFPRQLSGGMAKRILACHASLSQARYILAD
ncbi:hypothetical protein MJO10_30880, partial [Salmonella enterica subsp. enterica serovar Anatum]|nr:hypothetical protein [Salmonella enterica subsp. enterica serovar Anatum]